MQNLKLNSLGILRVIIVGFWEDLGSSCLILINFFSPLFVCLCVSSVLLVNDSTYLGQSLWSVMFISNFPFEISCC
ncbi:hypothetical protein GLYMA_09G033300v4 [Glycine max]|uniref:Uncharacterized protein n=1 Tax=Glycine max TaxID=3847 RepID=K7LBK9_SOYBN|nr:hypothetical protein JHK85_024454 [Glycine max]KAH1041291.1 hypothetical protein GYH30_023902 [Glycine max]KRH36942.1 hypothetical protein GLYMA_09G033300v4 [Glycine max]